MENDVVVLLCGGKSSRLGEPKGLVLFERGGVAHGSGRLWIEEQLARLARVGFREAVIAFGYELKAYRKALPWFADALSPNGVSIDAMHVRSVINPAPEHGPFSSLVAAGTVAGTALSSTEAAWILPIDVPCPAQSTWSVLTKSRADACVPTYQGRGGHPVRLSLEFLRTLLQLPIQDQDSRLDVQIHLLGTRAERIEIDDPTVVENRNLPKDWPK